MSKYLKKQLISLMAALIMFSSAAYGETTTKPAGSCPSAFPNLVQDICWKGIFPIRIGGTIVMNSGSMGDNVNTLNPDDWNPSDFTCMCKKKKIKGVTIHEFGLYVSFWEPIYVVEAVAQAGCYPFLFGMDMGREFWGTYGDKGGSAQSHDKAFYNVHQYTLPLMLMMELMFNGEYCLDDTINDIDLVFGTEFDPTWNRDWQTIFWNPEVLAFANPVTQALCAIDCAASTASFPLNWMFWCAGCWGSMYPLSGNTGTVGSPPRNMSLVATRLMARAARNPLPLFAEMDTSGPIAKCGAQQTFVLKKSQYRMSTLYPIAETSGKCAHPIGSATMTWGDWRTIPSTGEFQVYMIWRKRNCCLVFV